MKINNHFVTFAEWKEWRDYESYIFGGEESVEHYDAYRDTPSKEECDRMCARLSGEVKVFKVKKCKNS